MATALIKEMVDFFGHDENIFSLLPKAVILDNKFETIASVDPSQIIAGT